MRKKPQSVSIKLPNETQVSGRLEIIHPRHALSPHPHVIISFISSTDYTLLTLSSLNLLYSSSPTTSRELLSQFSTCSG